MNSGRLFCLLLLISTSFISVSSFSLREMYDRLERTSHPEGHRIIQKDAGFSNIDEIGTVGDNLIISRQDGPKMFLDDNLIPVQQTL